nr:hypothetical protein BaRGS_010030 [Batillaria attramentaria]
MLGLAFLMSAVAGVASDRFGLRKVAFTGGFLAFLGMLSSAFVQDLMLLYLTYGVLMLGVCRLVFGLLADVRCLNPVHMQQAALLTFGLMYDYFGSYTIAFHVFGITPVLGAIIMLCIPRQREVVQDKLDY